MKKMWAYAHLCPSPDAILDHEMLCHRRRDVDHMVAVVFLAHACFAVATDSEAKVLVLVRTRELGQFRVRGRSHVGVDDYSKSKFTWAGGLYMRQEKMRHFLFTRLQEWVEGFI
jgi:hypothetical protein